MTKKRIFGIVSIALIFLAILLIKQIEFDSQQANITTHPKQDTQSTSMSKLNVEKVIEEYESAFWDVVNNKEDNLKVKNFQSTEELMTHFKKFMSHDLAKWLLDTYFKEKNGNIFVITKDGPTRFKKDKPFKVEKVDKTRYKVIQERNNQMLGHVNIIFVLTYNGETWIVDDIQSENLEN